MAKGILDAFMSFDGANQSLAETYDKEVMFGHTYAIIGCKADKTYICRNYCKISFLTREDYDECAKLWP